MYFLSSLAVAYSMKQGYSKGSGLRLNAPNKQLIKKLQRIQCIHFHAKSNMYVTRIQQGHPEVAQNLKHLK